MSGAMDTVPLAPMRSVVNASMDALPKSFGLSVPVGVSHVPAIYSKEKVNIKQRIIIR